MRTEATALDSFFFCVDEDVGAEDLIGGADTTDVVNPLLTLRPKGGLAGVEVVMGTTEAGVIGEDGGEDRFLLVGGGGEEQLNMSSPYLAINSLLLKVGVATGRKEGGLSDDDEVDSSESFSPSELLSLVRLVLVGGLVGGEAVLNKW